MTAKPRARGLTVDEARQRRDELYAALNAGRSTEDPAYAWTYGERQPDRDCYSLATSYTDDDRRDIEVTAHHWPIDLERRFVAMYGKHDPESRWSYAVPAGVEVRSDEPEGWAGDRDLKPGNVPPADQTSMPWAAQPARSRRRAA